MANKGQIPWNKGLKGIHLSSKSEFKKGEPVGEKNPNWKGGVSFDRKRYHEKYKEKEIEYRKSHLTDYARNTKKWQQKHPEKVAFYSRTRRYRKKSSVGTHTLKEWEEMKFRYGYMCLCCKKVEPEIKLTEDHIIPLVKGGSNNIDNIQPLCGICNAQKYTKVINYGKDYIYNR